MYIETERLILRSPLPEDMESLYKIFKSDFVNKYNRFTEKSVEALQNSILQNEGVSLVLKSSGVIIGYICLKPDEFRYGVNSVDLVVWLGEVNANKGFMTEAGYAIVEYLFIAKKVERLVGRVYADNIHSRQLAEKIGFVQEGYLVNAIRNKDGKLYDLVLYTLSRQDYEKRNLLQ